MVAIYAIAPEGGAERRLTSDPGPDDAPAYSPDGRWIYFLSDRRGDGNRDLWRMPAAGAGPGDREVQRITSDDRDDAAPHPSPDGKWLVYLAYPPRTGGNALDRDRPDPPRCALRGSIRRPSIACSAASPTGWPNMFT